MAAVVMAAVTGGLVLRMAMAEAPTHTEGHRRMVRAVMAQAVVDSACRASPRETRPRRLPIQLTCSAAERARERPQPREPIRQQPRVPRTRPALISLRARPMAEPRGRAL